MDLVFDVVGVQQRQERIRLGVEIACGSRGFEQHANVRVVQRGGGVEAHLRVAVGIREQRVVRAHEPQPFPAVGEQACQWWGPGAQRGWAEHEGLLFGFLVLVEQDDHQAGPTAEAPEQGALADPGRGGDIVHRHPVGTAFCDEPPGRVQQEGAIARGITPFLRGGAGQRQRDEGVRGAHTCTLTQPELFGPQSG
jgi:hypothetical protein